MSPPTSRRSKQGSSPSPSPNPLPGIAIGIFAAIAAGFAASRALRRKRRLQSLKDEEHALTGDSLLVHEREIAIDEKIEPQCTAKDTITKAQVSPKHMDDLEFVRDAMKPVLSLQKSSAERKHEYDEEIKEVVNGKPPWGIAHNKGEEKIAETVDKGEVCSENEEITNMAVNNQVSFVSDEGSVRTLQRAVLMDEGEDENYVVVGDDEDTGEDGDDDRSSADQPLSPVLINGRILDFFEEMSELKDEPDFSASAGNSLSDSVSECSVQEVSSAPVKPSILADDAIEASWMTSKPDFIGASDQFGQEEVLLERKIWSDGGKRTLRILEHDLSTEGNLPHMEEIDPQADKEIFQLEKGLADSSDELDVVADVLDVKPVLITTIGSDFSIKDIDEIDAETLSHGSVALEGESSDTLIEECTDSARINGKALSDARILGECGQIETTSTEQAANASVDGILGFKFQDKAHGHSSRINGRDLSDKSENQPSSRVGLTSIARPGLQLTVEETACKTGFETEVQPIKGVPLDVPDADIKVELSVESIQDTAGRLGSTADNVLQATRGDDVDNSDATCESSGVMSFGKTDEGTMGISMDNLVENSNLEPDAESIHEMAGVESNSLEKHFADEESANTGHDVSFSVLIKEDGMADLTETVGVLTNNHAVIELNTNETQEIPSLESETLEESLHGEEPAMQAGECDITISEVTTEQSLDAMCDGAGLEQTMENSTSNLTVIAKVEPSAEPTEEMTCLESDLLEESLYAEDPGMQAGGHDAAMPSITTDDPLEESLHSMDTGTLAGGHEAAIPNIITDDNPDATYDSAGWEDHSISNGTGKISTDDPAENPEPIFEPTQGISSLESGPCQEFCGEEPVFQSGRHGIDISDVTDNDAENKADNEEEQLGSPLPPLEDTVEHCDVISGASADKVELPASRREDELAESGVADNRVHSKQQEIEEVLRDDDAFSDLQETAPVAYSLHRSPNNTREFDELFTREAAGMQSRSRFSSKVMKYLPLKIGLICLLIALVSFLLQYLEVPLSIITNNSP